MLPYSHPLLVESRKYSSNKKQTQPPCLSVMMTLPMIEMVIFVALLIYLRTDHSSGMPQILWLNLSLLSLIGILRATYLLYRCFEDFHSRNNLSTPEVKS